jgi:hypothetical protein
MKITGTCDFCGTNGEWEGGIWDAPPKDQPKDWAAFYPTRPIPHCWRTLAWAHPEFCEEHNITTVLRCPKCVS